MKLYSMKMLVEVQAQNLESAQKKFDKAFKNRKGIRIVLDRDGNKGRYIGATKK